MQHRVADTIRSAVASVTPQHSDSRFVSEGKLTPDEFVVAGDQLVFKFPSWEWATGKESRLASFLPPEKQYLITRNVPCKDRVRALDYALQHCTKTEGDWVIPDAEPDASAHAAGSSSSPATAAGGGAEIEVEEDFLNTLGEDLDGDVQENDPARAGGGYLVAAAPDDAHLKMRTYDLTITYDKYYQVPRLWLLGYDHQGRPLKPQQVYEDVLSEYVDKTVTIEAHPHEETQTASIHPCRHAPVMKGVVDNWIANGVEPRVDLALFVFLKFISGVVPTINYDFTMDIEW